MEGRIVYAAILIIIFGSVVAYIAIPNVAELNPVKLYRFDFSGQGRASEGNLDFTFTPTSIHGPLGDSLDFRLTATNIGNETTTFKFGEAVPLVLVYSDGEQVSMMGEMRTVIAILHTYPLGPGESKTVGWSWGADSFAEPMFWPGEYRVVADWFGGETYPGIGPSNVVVHWRTSSVGMRVTLLGISTPTFAVLIPLVVVISILIVLLLRLVLRVTPSRSFTSEGWRRLRSQ